MSLLTDYQSYYVYYHIDPFTSEVVYIGMGQKHRAWTMGTMRNHKINNKQYGHRNKDHNNWMEDLIGKSQLPCDWVRVQVRNLSKSKANEIEKDLIETHKPKFNITHSGRYHTPDLIDEAKGLRGLGLVFPDIAKLMKVSTMKAWRLCNVYKK